jgi:DNA recombination protein RmuC
MSSNIILIFIGIAVIGILAAILFMQRRKGDDQSLSILQQQLIALQEQIRSSLEGSQTRIDQLLKTSSEQLSQTHKTVGERLEGVSRIVGDRLDNASRAVKDLSEKMMKVEEAAKRVFEVGQDIASLQQILRAPKVRGGLGEVFLTDLLAQMLPQDAYEPQFMFADGERVDAVIKTAQGMVPVDSKFPLEDFQRMSQAESEEDKKSYRKLFIESVKKRVNETVKYIRPGEGTFDFALMYIPAENVYYEIITRDENLGEETPPSAYAISRRVIPVSPNTFYAYLNTILLGLKGMRIEKFVSEIIQEMGKVKTEFERFKDEFSKIGKHLSNAHSSYENADKKLGRLDDRLSAIDRPVLQGEEPKSLPGS